MSGTLCDIQSPSDIHATAQLDELKAASLTFLGNVKARFGEHSSQLYDVHKTLDAFRKGQTSKRNAHTNIFNTLDGHNDLRHALMDILMHPAAAWAPGDFDLPIEQPTQPFLEPAPRFLQPTHHPQMHLPSISSDWFTVPQVDQSASLMVLDSYNDHSPIISSPLLSGVAPLQLPYPPTHLWMNRNAKDTYTANNHDVPLPPPAHIAFRNPWQEANNVDTWTDDDMSFTPNGTYADEHFEPQESPGASYSNHPQPPVIFSQDVGMYQIPNSLQQVALPPVHTSKLTHKLLPSSTEADAFHMKSLEEGRPVHMRTSSTPVSQSPPDERQTRETGNSGHDMVTNPNHSLGGSFMHALCGKGFATLSGVKKHHWGKKVNDPATTTGCWAKHKKPDVSWDDHFSCKDGRSASETVKSVPSTFKQGQPKAPISQPKTLTALDIPQLNIIPGFPTLDNLPHTIAKTLGAGSAGSAGVSNPKERQPLYHTDQLPSQGSFESLLTAVNVVSQIAAPKPQARTDSLALHLDAQVATAEKHAHFVPYVSPTSSFDSQHARPIVPSALHATSLGMRESAPRGMSGSPTEHESEEEPPALLPDVAESSAAAAFSRPFRPLGAQLSGPAKKERKV